MLVQSTSTRWEQRRHQWWLSAGRSWWQWLFCRRPPPQPLPRDAAGSSSFGTKSVARNTSDCRKYVLGGWRVKIMRQIYWYCSSNLGVQRRIHSFYHHFQRKIVFNTANPSLSTVFGHGEEEYSKSRIEKWNCMLATSTGWRMSSRVESARQCILRPLNVLQRSRVNCRAERGTDGDVHIKTG